MLTRVLLTLLLVAFVPNWAVADDMAAEGARETSIVSLGLADRKVSKDDLKKRVALPKPRFNSPGVAYGWVAHAKKGDKIEVHLKIDGNSLMHNVREVTEDDIDVLLQAGKTGVPAGGWPQKRQYTAKVTVTRDGKTVAEQESDPVSIE
jgi:hypothetical protein